jgi:predicted nucleic acid-binding protein
MLDLWNSSPVDRYVPLHDSALRLAANLWANARNAGTPTADPKELDCDVLIAAQALNYQQTSGLDNHTLVIATVNVAHLSRFCTAELGPNILP